MSASLRAACDQCRAAKVRCDRERPSCARCSQRNIECTGLSSNAGFLFMNENDVARRNSQRARGEGGSIIDVPIDFDIKRCEVVAPSQQQQVLGNDERIEECTRIACPWLSQRALTMIPEPLRRDVESRAIERFFVNWILHPGRNGTPGHMANLPVLYYGASPDSALAYAVRTVAFADVRHTYENGVSFNSKARQAYGTALSRIRGITELESELASDEAFAALLLIDSFEVFAGPHPLMLRHKADVCMQTVYLSSEIPLGRHGEAIKYLLRLRGNTQLFNRSNFSLWSLANHRLQARQMLRHEEPDEVQMELLDLLDTGRPDIRICADIMKMTALCAAANKLVQRRNSPASLPDLLESTEQLVHRMQTLLADIEEWSRRTSQTWQPRLVDAPMVRRRPKEFQYSHDHPLAHLYCAKLIAYPDVWLAFIWGFHAACQIITRETFVALLEFQARLQGQQPDQAQVGVMAREREMVELLAASIIGSFPALMGFTNGAGEEDDVHPQGMMAGRCLALFAMEVIQKAKYPRFEHKDTAVAVVRWMSASYVLD